MSMEEIDIIELLKRIKEGKAPKLIQIGNEVYHFKEENLDLRRIYETVDRSYYWDIADLYFNTKIKILDKPIIEELEIGEEVVSYGFNREHRFIYPTTGKICSKINEIIKWINEKN